VIYKLNGHEYLEFWNLVLCLWNSFHVCKNETGYNACMKVSLRRFLFIEYHLWLNLIWLCVIKLFLNDDYYDGETHYSMQDRKAVCDRFGENLHWFIRVTHICITMVKGIQLICFDIWYAWYSLNVDKYEQFDYKTCFYDMTCHEYEKCIFLCDIILCKKEVFKFRIVKISYYMCMIIW
jgi:hypothetical protein